jgi:hypothetical protein
MTGKHIEFEGFAEGAEEDGADPEAGSDGAPFASFRLRAENDDIKGLSALAVKNRERALFRRFTSERNLEEMLDWEFQEGDSWHILTNGEIDAIAFLRMLVRRQPLDFLSVSTWKITEPEIDELRRLLEIGRLGRVDFYVGKLYNANLYDAYVRMRQLVKAYGGRVSILSVHAKTAVGMGPEFSFVMEGSANYNVNMKIENYCITIGRGLALAYKGFFDALPGGMRGGDFPDWRPWEPGHPVERQ